MKKLFCLGLCLLLVTFMFTACLNTPEETGTTSGEEESTTPGGGGEHTHVFAAEWTTDATNHWHAATCEHEDQKSDLGAHKDENADNKCDTCAYVMAYAVTVTAPDGAVVDEAAQNVAVGADATFAVTYSAIYRLSADNATLVDSVDNEDGTITWNFKVAAPTADTAVTVSAEKIVYGAPVAGGQVIFEDVLDAWVFYNGADVTVTLPAGDYYAYYLSGDANGNPAIGLSLDDCSTMGYSFTVEEDGEVTLMTRFLSMGYEEATDVSATYVIVECEDVTLSAMAGEGYILPTNVTSELVFTVPAPGLYALTSTVEGIILNDSIDPAYIFMATEAGQEIRVSVKCEDMTDVVFEFDWNVALVDGDALAEGANDVTIALEGYTVFTFTAPVAGSYSFVAESGRNYFFYWNNEYNYLDSNYSASYIAKNLEEGAEILVFVQCNDYEAIDDVADVITVSYAGILVEEGENTVATNGEGTEVTFVATYEGWFNLTADENTLIGIVGEDVAVEWVSAYEIYLAGENFAFLVKTADGAEADVVVTIENVVYKATLMIGENTVTLAPGKEYSIDLDGIGFFGAYLLSWENADVAIAVNGEEYVCGTEMNYTYYDTITLINNGDEAVAVVITLIDPQAQANTAAKLTGKFAVNFPMQGLYELTFTPDAEGFTGTLEVVDNNNGAVSGAYTYAVNTVGGVVFYKNGEETNDILISFDYWDNLTFQCPGLRMPATLEAVIEGGDDVPAGPVYDDAITGEDGVYSVNVENFWTTYVIGYTANVAGTYVISTADGETNAWIDGWYYNDSWGMWDVKQEHYIEGSGSYSFHLAAGETIYFWVSSNDGEADAIDIVISLQEADGGNDDAPVVEGGYDGAIYGDNGVYSVNVENAFADPPYVIGYTATEAGTYVISTADGEENAWVDGWYYNDGWGVWDREWANYIEGAGSYSFDLAAGETIYFMVTSNDFNADVIDLVISAQ